MLFTAVLTKPYGGKKKKKVLKGWIIAQLITAFNVLKWIEILAVQITAEENCLAKASVQSRGLFSANKTLFLPRHALFGRSQRAKWAKPWTASSLGPLSRSCPGLALGTGLDLSLWTGAISTKKKKRGFRRAGQPVWEAWAARLQNRTRTRRILWMFAYASKQAFHVCICLQFSEVWAHASRPQNQIRQSACVSGRRTGSKTAPKGQKCSNRSMAFVQLHRTCVDSGRGLICAANAVNNRACFVTAILSADTLITAQVMKERRPPYPRPPT